jgi:predicted nucleic acid-binding protein
MATVYIETSIVSHATAHPSADVGISTLQMQARDWWKIERLKYDVVTSQLVINEASRGDPEAAADRLKLLDGIPLVPITDEVRQIAAALVSASLMPAKAAADALHVAAAACAGVEYLLTQNCRHIANAHTLPGVYEILADHGCGGLLICTPAEFLGEWYDDKESNSR